MAWFSGKVSLGNFPDLAGAVTKLSESVKNIEKNFDNALGFEEKPDSGTSEASGLWPSAPDRKALFDPVMAFMGHRGEDSTSESTEISESVEIPSTEGKEGVESDRLTDSAIEQVQPAEEANDENLAEKVLVDTSEGTKTDAAEGTKTDAAEGTDITSSDPIRTESDSKMVPVLSLQSSIEHVGESDSLNHNQEKEKSEVESVQNSELVEAKSEIGEVDPIECSDLVPQDSHSVADLSEKKVEHKMQEDEIVEIDSSVVAEDDSNDNQAGVAIELLGSKSASSEETTAEEYSMSHLPNLPTIEEASGLPSDPVSHVNDAVAKEVEVNQQQKDYITDVKEQHMSPGSSTSEIVDTVVELEKVKRDVKMMETALHGAARQAQAKADEISKLMNENEQLKAMIEDLRNKPSEADIESLREEYHQRVSALERKVYALTKERDTLRREQNKRSDATALLKEKDEIITQVMAEGEQLSKKQAAQESQIRKLRAQIREFEEEKKGLTAKLQVEENKVESLIKDKTATEKFLQETIEKHQAELAAQEEYYTNALNAAKEAEVLAEARANNEARTELESRLRESEERETMLVHELEELRQTLTRKEQQAVYREDMLRRDIEDLQKRYQASERRCEELITQVPESTRPLLRQIEAMQETTAQRAEAWVAVERSLNTRLQEAEAKAATAEERQRSVNERLSQTLSRINVLEAQISCLRAEQTQLTRSLEKERQRAAENRQEYLAAKEEADTREGRVDQLEQEIRELRKKHKQDLQEALIHQNFLQLELEREKAARLELEKAANSRISAVTEQQSPISKDNSAFRNGKLSRKVSSATSISSMEESFFLQASLESESFSEHSPRETTKSPFFMKSRTPSAFEGILRQKEGELASYMSRLASLESIRDSLAEELVNLTAQCEKLRAEAAVLPGVRAELEALRRRHSAALELMGERDEELEELRADIVDLKEMYREQVNLLVSQIQGMRSSFGTA